MISGNIFVNILNIFTEKLEKEHSFYQLSVWLLSPLCSTVTSKESEIIFSYYPGQHLQNTMQMYWLALGENILIFCIKRVCFCFPCSHLHSTKCKSISCNYAAPHVELLRIQHHGIQVRR